MVWVARALLTVCEWPVKTSAGMSQCSLAARGLRHPEPSLCVSSHALLARVSGLQVKAIPFLMFDAGGSLELFDHEEFDNIVVKQATAESLAAKMDSVLKGGNLTTIQLAAAVTNGQQMWIKFHGDFGKTVSQNKKVWCTAGRETPGMAQSSRAAVPFPPIQNSQIGCLRGKTQEKLNREVEVTLRPWVARGHPLGATRRNGVGLLRGWCAVREGFLGAAMEDPAMVRKSGR